MEHRAGKLLRCAVACAYHHPARLEQVVHLVRVGARVRGRGRGGVRGRVRGGVRVRV